MEAGERRWSAGESADQSSSSSGVLPSCLVVSRALLMAGTWLPIGQDAMKSRPLIGRFPDHLSCIPSCPLGHTCGGYQLQLFCFHLLPSCVNFLQKQDKVNTADSAFIFLIIFLISKDRWTGWSGQRRWSCLVWSLLER